ncbi:sigma-70 family RNA polymerase sigma factor [Streptomyces sp. WMMB 322]|uniref:sigma-70 family RNA polymerase sigma factor n=1 Tax=Streptomyces sp. WMMB 322 TaxID=1286821 RepID=UPI0008239ACE|nr:sigma-70 family RNA polymerase sigma factor [Streptomyces sp. WMMB 322]SCK43377.1 DNA-directed RNA polymerase specialized sigma subunit, sigma24 family [Streptomyces sp. WMMB 322]
MNHRCADTGARAGGGPPEPSSAAGSPPDPLHRLVAAECAAEAPAAGEDPEELQQAVWLRWLEAGRPAGTAASGGAAGTGARPAVQPSARWLRGAVRAEARRARRRVRREIPLPDGGLADSAGADAPVLAAEQRRLLAAAVARLPGPCPEVMRALFSGRDLTYPEIAGELGISQGSLGPVRSRCLGCLRTMLAASDCGG